MFDFVLNQNDDVLILPRSDHVFEEIKGGNEDHDVLADERFEVQLSHDFLFYFLNVEVQIVLLSDPHVIEAILLHQQLQSLSLIKAYQLVALNLKGVDFGLRSRDSVLELVVLDLLLHLREQIVLVLGDLFHDGQLVQSSELVGSQLPNQYIGNEILIIEDFFPQSMTIGPESQILGGVELVPTGTEQLVLLLQSFVLKERRDGLHLLRLLELPVEVVVEVGVEVIQIEQGLESLTLLEDLVVAHEDLDLLSLILQSQELNVSVFLVEDPYSSEAHQGSLRQLQLLQVFLVDFEDLLDLIHVFGAHRRHVVFMGLQVGRKFLLKPVPHLLDFEVIVFTGVDELIGQQLKAKDELGLLVDISRHRTKDFVNAVDFVHQELAPYIWFVYLPPLGNLLFGEDLFLLLLGQVLVIEDVIETEVFEQLHHLVGGYVHASLIALHIHVEVIVALERFLLFNRESFVDFIIMVFVFNDLMVRPLMQHMSCSSTHLLALGTVELDPRSSTIWEGVHVSADFWKVTLVESGVGTRLEQELANRLMRGFPDLWHDLFELHQVFL